MTVSIKTNEPKRPDSYELREVNRGDRGKLRVWRNSERIRKYMYTDHEISQREHNEWFDSMIEDPERQYLILEYGNKPVGLVNFENIDTSGAASMMGCYLGETNVPRGTGTRMGQLAIDWIFRRREKSVVHAEVLDFNDASLRFFRRLGFEEKGCIRIIPRHGRSVGVIGFELHRDAWNRVKEQEMNATRQETAAEEPEGLSVDAGISGGQ